MMAGNEPHSKEVSRHHCLLRLREMDKFMVPKPAAVGTPTGKSTTTAAAAGVSPYDSFRAALKEKEQRTGRIAV